MNENPWKEGSGMAEVTATLKYGKNFNDAWLVVKGETAEEVHKAITEATGLGSEGLTLAQLVHNASSHVQSLTTVGATLGGTVISSGSKSEEQEAAPAAAQATASEESPQQEDEAPDLKALIAQASSTKELGDLFLAHKAAFSADQSLMAALQARSGELS